MTTYEFLAVICSVSFFVLVVYLCAYLTTKTKKTELEIEHLETCKKQLAESIEAHNSATAIRLAKPIAKPKDKR